jgi:4-amino-4-deoxy-L-arabinose transferase-like glycosyltransferase
MFTKTKFMLRKGFGVAFLLIICYFPLFFHLDSLPIQIYDESRLAVNAVRMADNGNFLVPYFGKEPDMWNTKPPLMIWFQVLSYKIFGISELSVRLPSAIAGLFTVLFIGFFCWKKLKRPILGLAAMGVLLTTPGYISTHVTRTGDYDSLLILFMVLFLFTFFRFVHSEEKKERQKWIFLSAIWLSLAVLTKSIAGLFFLPAAVIYLFWNKQVLKTLKSKDIYLAAGLFLAIVLSYYGLREVYNPGYLKAVWENELGGRYFETLENNNAPFDYYFKNIWNERFKPWIFILPIGLIVGFYEKGITRKFVFFLSIAIISYLLIISSANTKLQWYDAPVFPLLAVISALGIEKISAFLNTRFKLNQALFLVILFAWPYFSTIKTLYKISDSNPAQHYGLFMRELTDLKEYTLVHVDYNSHIRFYQMMYNKKGDWIKEVWPSKLKAGDIAMFCEKEPKRVLKERFKYEILEESWGCILVRILEKLD